jgi:hypothetical protein
MHVHTLLPADCAVAPVRLQLGCVAVFVNMTHTSASSPLAPHTAYSPLSIQCHRHIQHSEHRHAKEACCLLHTHVKVRAKHPRKDADVEAHRDGNKARDSSKGSRNARTAYSKQQP